MSVSYLCCVISNIMHPHSWHLSRANVSIIPNASYYSLSPGGNNINPAPSSLEDAQSFNKSHMMIMMRTSAIIIIFLSYSLFDKAHSAARKFQKHPTPQSTHQVHKKHETDDSLLSTLWKGINSITCINSCLVKLILRFRPSECRY